MTAPLNRTLSGCILEKPMAASGVPSPNIHYLYLK